MKGTVAFESNTNLGASTGTKMDGLVDAQQEVQETMAQMSISGPATSLWLEEGQNNPF